MNSKKIVLSLGAVLLILASATASPQSIGNQQKPPINKMAALIAPPHINFVQPHHDDQYCRQYELLGGGFGAAQGNMRVQIDGVPCTKYLKWSSTSILVEGPFFQWDHFYSFIIDDGAKPLSNFYKSQLPVLLEGPTPEAGHPGDIIRIHAWGAGSDPANMFLKMGNTAMQVTRWAGSFSQFIDVRVPNLAEGNIYDITLIRNNLPLGKPLHFRLF
jgi:hypothetical protein